MTITQTELRVEKSTTPWGTSSWSPAAFTSTASRILFVRISGATNNVGSMSGLTISGGGLTWNEWAPGMKQSGALNYSVFCDFYWAATGAGGSVTLTFDATPSIFQWNVRVVELDGANTSAPFGGTASSSGLSDTGALTLTLTTTPAADSITYGTLATSTNADSTVSEGSGFTQAQENQSGGDIMAEDEYDDTSPANTVTWADLCVGSTIDTNGWCALGVELQAAAATTAGPGGFDPTLSFVGPLPWQQQYPQFGWHIEPAPPSVTPEWAPPIVRDARARRRPPRLSRIYPGLPVNPDGAPPPWSPEITVDPRRRLRIVHRSRLTGSTPQTPDGVPPLWAPPITRDVKRRARPRHPSRLWTITPEIPDGVPTQWPPSVTRDIKRRRRLILHRSVITLGLQPPAAAPTVTWVPPITVDHRRRPFPRRDSVLYRGIPCPSIEPTLLTSNWDNTDQAVSYTTASVTPTTGPLLLFAMPVNTVGTPPDVTPSGLGVTWAETGTEQRNGRRISVFTGIGTPTSGTITLTLSAAALGCGWALFELRYANPTTPLVQTLAFRSTGIADTATGAPAVTLAAGGGTDGRNRAIAAVVHNINESTTPTGSGWVELSDDFGTTPGSNLETQWRPDTFDTTAVASWTTASPWCAAAVEVAAVPCVVVAPTGQWVPPVTRDPRRRITVRHVSRVYTVTPQNPDGVPSPWPPTILRDPRRRLTVTHLSRIRVVTPQVPSGVPTAWPPEVLRGGGRRRPPRVSRIYVVTPQVPDGVATAWPPKVTRDPIARRRPPRISRMWVAFTPPAAPTVPEWAPPITGADRRRPFPPRSSRIWVALQAGTPPVSTPEWAPRVTRDSRRRFRPQGHSRTYSVTVQNPPGAPSPWPPRVCRDARRRPFPPHRSKVTAAPPQQPPAPLRATRDPRRRFRPIVRTRVYRGPFVAPVPTIGRPTLYRRSLGRIPFFRRRSRIWVALQEGNPPPALATRVWGTIDVNIDDEGTVTTNKAAAGRVVTALEAHGALTSNIGARGEVTDYSLDAEGEVS